VLDRDRVLTKLDELDGYVTEMCAVRPATFEDYMHIPEKKRATERLLQIAVQCVLDICHLLVSGLRLGLPAEEDDLLQKLGNARVLSGTLIQTLRSMKGFRNILVHEYGDIDNALVFKAATARVQDFLAFKAEVLDLLHKQDRPKP
jgi:uncharacterized protein YutE (UPF0331/DUF86 family)